jgi:hypothetical protein
MTSDSPGDAPGTTFGKSTLVLILIFSTMIWAFFYVEGMPLKSGETVLVVGVCALAVVCCQWLWKRLRGGRPKP